MATSHCNSIKQYLLEYLREQVGVSALRDKCLITLPIKTLDDRSVSVFVEQKLEDYYVVHDGGKTLAELFVQGVSLTDAKKNALQVLAKRFGAELASDVFTIGCKTPNLENAILSISQCATLAMFDLIGHHAIVEDEPLSAKVARSLKRWKPDFIANIERRVAIEGKRFPHSFDFVGFSANESRYHTVGLKLLTSAYSPRVQAERYGFLVLDIENTFYSSWRRLAIVHKAEEWPQDARRIVASLSQRVLEVKSGEESAAEEVLPSYMDELVA